MDPSYPISGLVVQEEPEYADDAEVDSQKTLHQQPSMEVLHHTDFHEQEEEAGPIDFPEAHVGHKQVYNTLEVVLDVVLEAVLEAVLGAVLGAVILFVVDPRASIVEGAEEEEDPKGFDQTLEDTQQVETKER